MTGQEPGLDEARLEATAATLSPAARALATQLAFGAGGIAVSPHSGRELLAAVRELERHDLAHAYSDLWRLEYWLPSDSVDPLRRLLAALRSGELAPAGCERLLAAPLQTAHDAAALWAHLQREPARVKANGDLYQRAQPRLVAALPQLDAPLGMHFLDDLRMNLAIGLLRDGGFLRVRVAARPGANAQRELVPDGDLADALDATDEELRAGLLAGERPDVLPQLGWALAWARAGATVSLADAGRALHELVLDAGYRLDGSWPDELIALLALAPAWLTGGLELGVDGDGAAVAVRFGAPQRDAPASPLAVCQGNFEVVLLRSPSPLERLRLVQLCEPTEGQAHVLRIARPSVAAAARAKLDPPAVLAGLVGAVPQNVARSIADWAEVPRPLRLRSALFLDAGDSATADELAAGPLAALVAERLSESLLALRGSELAAVERALRAAGHQLEPGLDRASGSWTEQEPASFEAESAWMPHAAPVPRPQGQRISTVDELPPKFASADQPADGEPPLDLDLSEDEVFELIVEALEAGRDLEIVYHGARELTQRRVTPIAIERNHLVAFCHARRAERSFQLERIVAATPASTAAAA